ncbi:cytochrome b [Magnetococcus sp. PR-3]|uniref:cytochrome b n=1 Tax=Magnetococcus sp. PR-3 TaxID=3120355 RepID=UPI002FCE5F94
MFHQAHNGYTRFARLLHWLMALLLVSMLALGWYMTGLSYYDPDYRWTVALHKSAGAVFFLLALLRMIYRLRSAPIPPHKHHARWEQRLAHGVHLGFYGLFFLLPITGYLISTADGHPVVLFETLKIPALMTLPGQADVAGWLHNGLGVLLVVWVALHVGGALKHHFIDKDTTLWRMLWHRKVTDKS